jgi:transcriptional regulator with XRE-family HTH domain
MDIKEIIGAHIRELRDERKLTRQDLAKTLDIGTPSITAYEAGSQMPPVDNLAKLADYFNVSIDYMIGRTRDKLLHQLYRINPDEEEFISVIIGALVQATEGKEPLEVIDICQNLAEKEYTSESRRAILTGISLAVAGLMKGRIEEQRAKVDKVIGDMKKLNN